MKTNRELYEAVLQQRDALQAARAKRNRRARTAIAVFVPVLLVAVAVTAFALRGAQPPVDVPTAQTDTAEPTPGVPTGVYDYAAQTTFPYEVLVDEVAVPCYAGSGMLSLVGFSETIMVKAAVWLLEGTVLETHIQDHTYVVRAPGKFGAKTMTITTPLQSVVTTFRVERVLHGDAALEGQTITLEDKIISYDGIFGYKTGAAYVFLVEDHGKAAAIDHIESDEELLSGDLTRVSRYATLYPFIPPIERTADGRGYIVSADWVHLVRKHDADVFYGDNIPVLVQPQQTDVPVPADKEGEDHYVAMTPGGGSTQLWDYYRTQMKLVPKADFDRRMNALLTRLFPPTQ